MEQPIDPTSKKSFIEYITCPITKQIYLEPVMAEDGHTYEKTGFIESYMLNKKSPVSNAEISANTTTNYLIKSIVDMYLHQNPDEKCKQFVKIIVPKGEQIYNNTFDYTLFDWHEIFKLSNYDACLLYRNEEKMIYIIDNSIDLEHKDSNKWTPIHYICKYSTNKVIKHIVDKGANLEVMTENKWKAIHFVCLYSTPTIIKYVRERTKDINDTETDGLRTIDAILERNISYKLTGIVNKTDKLLNVLSLLDL